MHFECVQNVETNKDSFADLKIFSAGWVLEFSQRAGDWGEGEVRKLLGWFPVSKVWKFASPLPPTSPSPPPNLNLPMPVV